MIEPNQNQSENTVPRHKTSEQLHPTEDHLKMALQTELNNLNDQLDTNDNGYVRFIPSSIFLSTFSLYRKVMRISSIESAPLMV